MIDMYHPIRGSSCEAGDGWFLSLIILYAVTSTGAIALPGFGTPGEEPPGGFFRTVVSSARCPIRWGGLNPPFWMSMNRRTIVDGLNLPFGPDLVGLVLGGTGG